MTRLFLPRYPLRSPIRSGRRSTRKRVRSPRLEQLDKRLVLSGMAEVAFQGAPVDSGSSAQVAVMPVPEEHHAVAAGVAAPQTDTSVYLADDGVLHVQPAVDAAVVVRQFIDFQLEEIVEIEMAGQWLAFPAAQVSAVQVQVVSNSQTLNVDAGVSKPVQLVEPPAIDEMANADMSASIAGELVSSQISMATATTPVDTSAALALPSETTSTLAALPEGEPGGSTPPPILAPPRITDFTVARNGDFWEFSGNVTDDKGVAGLVVRFGGLLSGSSAVVNEQGHFQIVVSLPPGTHGLATAQTTDTDGLLSNLAYCSVNYPG